MTCKIEFPMLTSTHSLREGGGMKMIAKKGEPEKNLISDKVFEEALIHLLFNDNMIDAELYRETLRILKREYVKKK